MNKRERDLVSEGLEAIGNAEERAGEDDIRGTRYWLGIAAGRLQQITERGKQS